MKCDHCNVPIAPGREYTNYGPTLCYPCSTRYILSVLPDRPNTAHEKRCNQSIARLMKNRNYEPALPGQLGLWQ
jgi:hypothetical protein